MKDGFVLAMHELGRIQDWDKNLSERVETSEKNNQLMINDLTHSVEQLKVCTLQDQCARFWFK